MQPSYRTILKYYWSQARKHKGYFALVFIGYGVGIIFGSIIGPLLYRQVIDVVTIAENPQSAWPELVQLLILIGLNSIFFRTFFRFADVAASRFEARTMKDLMDFAFAKLTNHSYKFFANSFAGSLVTKVKRFVRSFEDASDQLFFVFWLLFFPIAPGLYCRL